MPRDGSGTFNRAVDDYTSGTVISSDSMNTEMDQIATALTDSIAKDGQTIPTANLPMGTYKHTGVGDASARDQYLAAGQLQDGEVIWHAGAGTANAITANYSPAITALVDGMLLGVRATAANTSTTVTFSPNGLTPETIYNAGSAGIAVGNIAGAGHELLLRYHSSGTPHWELLNPAPVGSEITGVDADTLDSLDSTQFLRSDADDSASGDITFSGTLTTAEITGGPFELTKNAGIPSTVNKAILSGGWASPVSGMMHIGDGTGYKFEWLNKISGIESVVATLTDSGVMTLEGDSNKVWHAGNISTGYGISVSKASSGYTQLPGGIILQWGSQSFSANTDTSVTLPIAFPGSFWQGLATHVDAPTGSTNAVAPGVKSGNTTTITIRNTADSAITIGWLAIGS